MGEPLLKRVDQAPVAAVTATALVCMAVWWVARGGHRDGLVNVERAEPLEYAFRVNANTAAWPELAQLPEVGEILARRVVEHREQNGPFVVAEDLLAVSGIGEKKLARFRVFLLPLPGDNLAADTVAFRPGDRSALEPPDHRTPSSP